MCKVLRAVHAENKPDEVGAHHQQDVEDAAGRTRVTIPPSFPKLHTKNKEPSKKGLILLRSRVVRNLKGCRRTIDGGSTLLAMISGRMNIAASQPHANSLGLRSCHSATKVKINILVAA